MEKFLTVTKEVCKLNLPLHCEACNLQPKPLIPTEGEEAASVTSTEIITTWTLCPSVASVVHTIHYICT